MRRRTLLGRAAALGAVGALGLAGCQGPTNSPGAGDGNGDGDSPTAEPSPTPRWEAPVADVRLRTTDGTCASGDEPGAAVSFDEADGTLGIQGQVTAPTPCHRVHLDSVRFDEAAAELTVVLTTAPGDQDACVECVGALSFDATVEIAGSLPETVAVVGPEGELARVDRGEATETPSGDNSVRDSTFEVVERSGGSGESTAEVTFDDAETRITVTGTIVGSDGCKTATLSDVTVDPAADRATVSVATNNRPGTEGQVCTQALVAIDYEATVTFEGATPAEVAVVHDGEEVARAGHGSARAGPDSALADSGTAQADSSTSQLDPGTATTTATRTDGDADDQ